MLPDVYAIIESEKEHFIRAIFYIKLYCFLPGHHMSMSLEHIVSHNSVSTELR